VHVKVALERFVTKNIGKINLAPALAEGKRGKQQIDKKD
jgi:hypothetical protein